MSTFLTKADFKAHIRANLLDQITEFDDTIIDMACDMAVSEVAGYLNSRYDVDAIFAATGAARNITVLSKTVDVALFQIHHLINPKKVPEYREAAYERAIDWLKMTQSGKIDQPGLPRPVDPETNEKNYVLYGSNPKRDNRL